MKKVAYSKAQMLNQLSSDKFNIHEALHDIYLWSILMTFDMQFRKIGNWIYAICVTSKPECVIETFNQSVLWSA